MPLDFDSDVLGPCVEVFGEVAQGFPLPVYTPASGPSFTIDGIFDEAYHEDELLAGPGITAAQPVFGTRQSLFPAGIKALQADGIVIRGVGYVVREPRLDGKGGVKLMLNLAS